MLATFHADISTIRSACEQLESRRQDEYVIQTQRCLHAEACRSLKTAAYLDATIEKNPHLPESWADHCLSAEAPRLAAVASLAREIADEERLAGSSLLGLVRSHLACACEDVVAASGLKDLCQGLERVAGVKLASGLVEGWEGGFGPRAGDDDVLRALSGPGRSATRLATVGRVSAVLRGLRESSAGEGPTELEAGDEACVRRAAALLARSPGAAATEALAARLEALAQARLWRVVMQPRPRLIAAPKSASAASGAGIDHVRPASSSAGLLSLLAHLRRWCLLGRGSVFRQALHPGSDAGALQAPSNAIPLRTVRCPAPRSAALPTWPLQLSAGVAVDARVTTSRLRAAWSKALAETATTTEAADAAMWSAHSEEDALATALLDGAASASDRDAIVQLRAPSLALLLPPPPPPPPSTRPRSSTGVGGWGTVTPCSALAMGNQARVELQADLLLQPDALHVVLVGAGCLSTPAPASAADTSPYTEAGRRWSSLIRQLSDSGSLPSDAASFRDRVQSCLAAQDTEAGGDGLAQSTGGGGVLGAVTLRPAAGAASWEVVRVTMAVVGAETSDDHTSLQWRVLAACCAETETETEPAAGAGAFGAGALRPARLAMSVSLGGSSSSDAASLSAGIVSQASSSHAAGSGAAAVLGTRRGLEARAVVPAGWSRWCSCAAADEAAALAGSELGDVARVGTAPLPGVDVPVTVTAFARLVQPSRTGTRAEQASDVPEASVSEAAASAGWSVERLAADSSSCNAAVVRGPSPGGVHIGWMAARGSGEDDSSRHPARRDAWWHCSVPVRVGWPLSLVVGHSEQQAYQSLSTLLVRHRRAVFRLDDCWARLRLLHTAAAAASGSALLRRPKAAPPATRKGRAASNAPPPRPDVSVPGLVEWCARASLGLWALRSLASGIETVWHASVLEPASSRLFGAAAASRDFTALLRAHRVFLAAAVSGMLLGNNEAARALESLQDAAAQLHGAVCRVSSAVAGCQEDPCASTVLAAARAVADTGGDLAAVAGIVADEGRAFALVAAALPSVDRSDAVATASGAAWAEFAESTARPAAAASSKLARP
jgi:hypothetical protein